MQKRRKNLGAKEGHLSSAGEGKTSEFKPEFLAGLLMNANEIPSLVNVCAGSSLELYASELRINADDDVCTLTTGATADEMGFLKYEM